MTSVIKRIWRLLITQTFWKSQFGAMGFRTTIFSPMMIEGASRIFLGNRVLIRDFARLETISRPQLGWLPILKVGNNVNIEQGVHIICQCEVIIEDDVSITPYCAIVDTYHPYGSPDVLPKIGDRLPTERTYVHIGAGTFVGIRSIILPNVRIGKGCVIGAGSVVNCDIPDYSVAVGAPAGVISRFDFDTNQWLKVSDGRS